MPVSKYTITLFLLLACGSCIVPFEPVIDESQEVLVINGVITDIPGNHYVTVSVSSPYNQPEYKPVSGCVVAVADESGDIRVYHEISPGYYEAALESAFLRVGKSYSLSVQTSQGSEYRSEYDSLLACPPIDSVYYEVESQGTADPDITHYGLQFYNDVAGTDDGSRSFRWKLEETWEYTSPHTADAILDDDGLRQFPGYAISICYKTNQVRSLYTGSTRSLAENQLNRNALHYVSNQSPRLSFKYSLLVEQQSLTNDAFDYWDQMRASTSEGGGLYETQPSSTIGNIYNTGRPEEKVLGFFYATQGLKKRITVENDFEFPVDRFRCFLTDTLNSLDEFGGLYPYYMISLGMLPPGPPWIVGPNLCFDCREYGGVTEKPDFW